MKFRAASLLPTSLEEVRKHLEALEVYGEIVELPITDQSKIKDSIAQLHKIFEFKKAPDFIFNLPPLPEATWDDIPEKLIMYL